MHKGILTNWGGVGILAKENIPIEVCHEFDLNTPDCEDIWVQIELEHRKKCVSGVIYRHPKQNLNRFHLSFEKVLELLSCKNVTYTTSLEISTSIFCKMKIKRKNPLT